MSQEFEGDLTGAVFWGADLSGATFRDVNLTGARVSHAWLVDVEIDALVDRLVINGVDVTAFINERDSWYPLRAMLRPADPTAMQATWATLSDKWAAAVAHAQALPVGAAHQSVNGEFSFVQTLQHLVFATDKWFTSPVQGEGFAPFGLPNTGSLQFPWPGLDLQAAPTFEQALAVWADRVQRVREFVATVPADDFTRPIEVLENGPHPLVECLYTVFEEAFWHLRYATRDLAIIAAGQ